MAIYRLYFHPLAKLPGPRLYAITSLPFLVRDKILGTWVMSTTELHAKYGRMVRFAPDRVSVDGSIGWSDIYQRRPNLPEFDKDIRTYQVGRLGLLPALRDDHRRQRRTVAHAFSVTALKEQETYVQTHLDFFIGRMHEFAAKDADVDISNWLNYLTFDIVGDLALGEPFGCMANGGYHPFVSMIFDTAKANAMGNFMDNFKFLSPLVKLMGKKELRRNMAIIEMAAATTEKRIALGPDARKDFMTYLLRKSKDGEGLTHPEILTNSRVLIVAGSETTATALCGLIFYLSRTPQAYRRLVEEIRSFTSEDQITMQTLEGLPYLNACLEEILRIYPPAADTPPRISPGAEVGGYYIPEGVSLFFFFFFSRLSSPYLFSLGIQTLTRYQSRPSYPSTNGLRTTTRTTLSTLSLLPPSVGCLEAILSTKASTTKITRPRSGHLRLVPGTASERTSPIPRCA